jgi:hypothetical protein
MVATAYLLQLDDPLIGTILDLPEPFGLAYLYAPVESDGRGWGKGNRPDLEALLGMILNGQLQPDTPNFELAVSSIAPAK